MTDKKILKKYIGNKAFYSAVLAVAVPIMVQNGVSSRVRMLDNLMIGHLGTDPLSGVAISNQLMFVFFLLVFGATAGVGIFTAQYHGMGDTEGVRNTFRAKLVINTVLCIICILVLKKFSKPLIAMFLHGGEYVKGDVVDHSALILSIGSRYMDIMLFGLIPVGITNAFAGTLRDTGQTKVPMMASVIAIFVNLIGNLLLIYGYLGLPALGADGAAIATVISRFVEMFVLIIYTTTHSKEHPFIKGVFRHFFIPGRLMGKYLLKSLPLMLNETLWAAGQTFMNQCYSYRSLDAVAALNIENTLWGFLGVAFLAMGEAVGILVGQVLGSGDIEKAKDHARKMRAFTVGCGIVFGLLMILISPFFPLLYNTSDLIRFMATKLIVIFGALMPVFAYTHASYFTIRSGGNTFITFVFDSCFAWLIVAPLAYVLSRYTQIDVVLMVLIVQSAEILKAVIGGAMVISGIWAKNIVKQVGR
ncbi:MAG: MATE family efflux transporter [Lachnospiraceae bacterium]|nr:MATE family efflux transporter [Lachnospiraceae bacterium]